MSDMIQQPMGTGTLNDPEPPPVKNEHPELWPMLIAELSEMEKIAGTIGGIVINAVIEDAKERHSQGVKKYGVALQPFNGRDALKDAYQEALDMLAYTRQVSFEADTDAKRHEADEMMSIALNSVLAYRAVIYTRDMK